MIKLLLQTYLVIFTIPFLTYALDPKDPKSICERLVNDPEKKSCLTVAEKNPLDWYAAAACNELSDDDIFMDCWRQIVGARFNPETLDFCTRRAEEPDKDRLKCILGVRNKSVHARDLKRCLESKSSTDFKDCISQHAGRMPASEGQSSEFQSLKIQEPRK